MAADLSSYLRLENVGGGADPAPYYYSVRATPDPNHVSKVAIAATGCADGESTDFPNLCWGDRYLEIGVDDRTVPDPGEEDLAALLAGPAGARAASGRV